MRRNVGLLELSGSSLFGVAYGDCDVSVVTVLGS